MNFNDKTFFIYLEEDSEESTSTTIIVVVVVVVVLVVLLAALGAWYFLKGNRGVKKEVKASTKTYNTQNEGVMVVIKPDGTVESDNGTVNPSYVRET